MILGFIALHREARVRAIAMTGDVIIFQAQEIKGKPKANVFGAAHTETRGAKSLRLNEIGRFFDARG